MPIPTRLISSGFKTKPPNCFIPAFFYLDAVYLAHLGGNAGVRGA
jgi:hypothetical protein